MTDRRRFLTSTLAAVVAGLGSGFARRAAAAGPSSASLGTTPARRPAALAGARALSPGFHMVDGWILTDRDLEVLARHVA